MNIVGNLKRPSANALHSETNITDNHSSNKPLMGVDVLRHLLTFAVIFQHMRSNSNYSYTLNQKIYHWSLMIDGAVACFFLLSGYFSKPGINIIRIRAMARKLLIPYIIFSAIYTASLTALHKIDIGEALIRTATFAGVGPQLYFLPYLFVISIVIPLVIDLFGQNFKRQATIAVILALLIAYLALATVQSTGADYRLLALYGLAYAIGMYRARYASEIECLVVVVTAAIILLAISWERREWDLAVVLLITEFTFRVSSIVGKTGRLPGSGGIYLIHTPILNYAIAMVMAKIGILEIDNLIISLILTYAISLLITLFTIRVSPQIKSFILE
jgi:hypothetical protein